MKIFILNLFLILFLSSVNSAELKIDAYGKEDIFAYDVSESRKFFIWSSDAVWTTNIGITGSNTGRGSVEIINGETTSNIMSKWTEKNGDHFFAQFLIRSGSAGDATIQVFEIISGNGRWEELVGQKCLGAYIPIVDSKFMWQGKCEMSNKTNERLQNYKKPE